MAAEATTVNKQRRRKKKKELEEEEDAEEAEEKEIRSNQRKKNQDNILLCKFSSTYMFRFSREQDVYFLSLNLKITRVRDFSFLKI